MFFKKRVLPDSPEVMAARVQAAAAEQARLEALEEAAARFWAEAKADDARPAGESINPRPSACRPSPNLAQRRAHAAMMDQWNAESEAQEVSIISVSFSS